jgi:hypothetical protein
MQYLWILFVIVLDLLCKGLIVSGQFNYALPDSFGNL